MAFDCYYLAYQWIFNNLINQTKKQAICILASSLFLIVLRVDVTLYVQILINFVTVTIAKLLQLHFTLLK